MKELETENLDVFSSIHFPYWITSTEGLIEPFPTLDHDLTVDVAIIGGGIVGITAAYLLKDSGLKVAVLEANKISRKTTGHTTAKITMQHGLIYNKLVANFGEEKALQYKEANENAIEFIRKLVHDKNIDCDFSKRSAYVYTQSEKYIEQIEREVETAVRLGIKAHFRDKIPLPFDVKGAVEFEDQAQFHPLKYLLALAKDIPNDRCNIFENTQAVDIEEGEPNIIKTRNGARVNANYIIIASHFPMYDGLGLYFTRIYVEKSYIITAKIQEDFPAGIFINAEEPTRSLRSQKYNGEEIILVAGEHHKTGSETNTNVHYDNLGAFAKETFNVKEILHRWSTQDCMTPDGLPYIGYLTSKTPTILVATGFGKWGMTNGTAAARILTDLIILKDSPYAPVFNPSRFNLVASGKKLVTENLDVVGKLISGKLSIVPTEIELKPGEAKVAKIDGERVGVYRDHDNNLHIVDITCTHLGCELVWNEAETTWDCPCHGSRFNYDGENIEGPAFNRLKRLDEEQNVKDPNIV